MPGTTNVSNLAATFMDPGVSAFRFGGAVVGMMLVGRDTPAA